MYFHTTFHLLVLWAMLMLGALSEFTTRRKSIIHDIARNFYDTLTNDFETDDRLNASFLESLDTVLSEKLRTLNIFHKRDAGAVAKKLDWLDVSFKRLNSFTRNCNIVIVGLKYSTDWNEVYEQLEKLTAYLGLRYEDRHVRGFDQVRLPKSPLFSRLTISFKKVQTKQLYLLKFKQKLEEYEKENRIGFGRVRKIALVPGLDSCRIYVLDDIDGYQKNIMKALKSLQRIYPDSFSCYIKDSRVYYKIFDMSRPSVIDQKIDILFLERKLHARQLNKTNSQRWKVFRTGTVFSYDEYQYNRTRKEFTTRLPKFTRLWTTLSQR